MITEDKFGLKPIWEAILEIYDEFCKICDRHGLRYYVTDGNALGAVRHKGFIPWDDDLDVCMPRPDYEKFIEIAQRELPGHLKFVYWRNTPEYYWLFGKIQDARREVVERVEKQVGHMLSGGLFLDVFPIEGYPEGRWQIFWVKFKNLFLLPLSRYRLRTYRTQSKKGKKAWIIGMLMSPFFPCWRTQPKMMAFLDGQLKKFPFEMSRNTGRACSRINVLYRSPVLRSAWGTPKMMEFYDRQVPLPSDYDAHLRSEFGPNYMTPPPASKQHPTHGYSYRCAWWLGPTKPSSK